MRFHDYTTMKPASFRGSTEDYISSYLLTEHDGSSRSAAQTMRASIECGWLRRDRPFYNVYPIAIELCAKTSLNMRWGDILFPTRYLLLRFAAGHEPFGLKSALFRVPTETKESTEIAMHCSRFKAALAAKSRQLCGSISATSEQWGWAYNYSGDVRGEVVQDSIGLEYVDDSATGATAHGMSRDNFEQANFLIRLLAFIGLLARGKDLITPAILSKDRDDYDATTDSARRRWLEERAARRQGTGFDVGRSLEIDRAVSPHWRSPHLALFHTGPGRSVPILKIRSGAVVIPKDMSHIPTGYMGTEKPDERPAEITLPIRPSIPSGLRFNVMRRDGHRCRLCGLTADDGVQLQVDHIVPVAKGGKTVIENLWLLCQPCNSGKSKKDLYLTTQAEQGGFSHGL